MRGVAHGVGEQVEQHLAHARGVDLDERRRVGIDIEEEFEVLVLRRGAEGADDAAQQVRADRRAWRRCAAGRSRAGRDRRDRPARASALRRPAPTSRCARALAAIARRGAGVRRRRSSAAIGVRNSSFMR